MFPPNNRQQRSKNAILLIMMLAVLAHMCSLQLAHGAEKFLSNTTAGLCIEVRPQSTVVGDEIHLRQIARWSDSDKTALDPIGEIVIGHFGKEKAFKTIAIDEIKSLLADAGVKIATLNFMGPVSCRVNRSDAAFAPGQAIEQYTAVQQAVPTDAIAAVPDSPFHTLRDLLTANLSEKLNIEAEDLQITFRGQDEVPLRLCEPHYHFNIDPVHTSNLGDVSWNVTATSDTGVKRYAIVADAKAWRRQQVLARPLASRQLITEQDVIDKRTLVSQMPNDVVLDRKQVLNQAAARDLKPGTVMTARLVDPVQMIKSGQYVSVQSFANGISITAVARALEGGSFGQSIRVRNESTKEIFSATITGPQQASLAGSNSTLN